jgi:NAD(P)-dependent dehydrogenase (short-subunit alcohol dehydrogenase family)
MMTGKAATPVFDLSGRVALVTGASSGLGERFATILAASGAAVVLAARRTDRLEQACAAIKARGGRVIAVAMDVADEASTIAAYDAAEAAFGTVDTIVANAGMNSEGSVLDLPVDEFDRVMGVNLRGVFLTAREGAKRLIASGSRESGRGRVVITASITAHTIAPGLAVYSASKAGVVQLGKVMARDWVRQGINVNMICPGYIKTEINGDWFDTDGGARQIAKFPRRRVMAADELDTMLLYLASDASGGVTGTSFTIDDGQSL